MTMELFTGVLGSGKSVHAATKIAERTRRPVIMNFQMARMRKNWHFWDNEGPACETPETPLTVHRLVRFTRSWHDQRYGKGSRFREHEILLVVDEAAFLWNSRDFNAKGGRNTLRAWLRFFALSRKLGFDVILIAQFDKQIDKQIRELVEYEVLHLSAKHMFPVKYLVRLFPFVHVSLISRRWYAAKGIKQKAPSFKFFFPWHFSLYDSMATFNAPDDATFAELTGEGAAGDEPAASGAGVPGTPAVAAAPALGLLDRIARKQAGRAA